MKQRNAVNPLSKIVLDYNMLVKLVEAHRVLGGKIVLTIGSWDLLHIGHLRYLNKAKSFGDILIVGADSDEAMARYKGQDRPMIPQNERLEMLSYQECVNFVTTIDDVGYKGEWYCSIAKMLMPDFFVAVEDSYSEEQRKMIEKYCGKLIVLPRQAEGTSTSDIIQNIIKKNLPKIKEILGDPITTNEEGG